MLLEYEVRHGDAVIGLPLKMDFVKQHLQVLLAVLIIEIGVSWIMS